MKSLRRFSDSRPCREPVASTHRFTGNRFDWDAGVSTHDDDGLFKHGSSTIMSAAAEPAVKAETNKAAIRTVTTLRHQGFTAGHRTGPRQTPDQPSQTPARAAGQ